MKTTILILILSVTSAVLAKDLIWGESAQMDTLASIVRSFVQTHGEMPKNWDDLAKEANMAMVNKTYLALRGESLEEKFVFVDSEFDIPGHGRAIIVLIRTAPLNASTGDRRYFVCALNGGVTYLTVPESEAEEMFEKTGKELPGKGKKADQENIVNGKMRYIAADPTATPAPVSTLSPDRIPFQNNPMAKSAISSVPTEAKGRSNFLIAIAIVATGLLIGAGAFLLRRK